MNSERRLRMRLPWLKFSALVKVQRSLFNAEWINVVPYDYSEFGMGIQTDEQFDLEDKVILSLCLEMEVGQITIEAIPGIVRYKEKHHSRFNYGIEFDQSARQLSLQSTRDHLIHIKKALQKQQRLRDKK